MSIPSPSHNMLLACHNDTTHHPTVEAHAEDVPKLGNRLESWHNQPSVVLPSPPPHPSPRRRRRLWSPPFLKGGLTSLPLWGGKDEGKSWHNFSFMKTFETASAAPPHHRGLYIIIFMSLSNVSNRQQVSLATLCDRGASTASPLLQ